LDPQDAQPALPMKSLKSPSAHAAQTTEPLARVLRYWKPAAHWQLAALPVNTSALPAAHAVSWQAPSTRS
jgi:hypothetical protein